MFKKKMDQIQDTHRVEPYIYRDVILNTQSKANKFIKSLQISKKPKAFYAEHVKSFCVNSNILLNTQDVFKALLLFDTMTELVLWCKLEGEPAAHARIINKWTDKAKITRISTPMGHINHVPRPNFIHALFSNISHLLIVDKTWGNRTGWKELRGLTHLAFVTHSEDNQYPRTIRSILAECHKLKMLLLLVTDEYGHLTVRREVEEVRDARLAIVPIEWEPASERMRKCCGKDEGIKLSIWLEGQMLVELQSGTVWTGE